MDISHWQSASLDLVPIGKRIKRVVIEPHTEHLYYFKIPKEKYPWEFWSEIISYKIGTHLGFNVLKYEPATLEGQAGCLSPSMVSRNEELIHGQQFLTQILPTFETKKGTDHSFLLIRELFLKDDSLMPLLNDFILMLVFDSIIGNRDRHQQNWAIIRGINLDFTKLVLNAQIFNKDITITKLFLKIITSLFSKQKLKQLGSMEVKVNEYFKFSPYFDNGNCLAYNILEDNLRELIKNDNKLDSYLFGNKATSHVKWDGDQITHFELIKSISEEFSTPIENAVKTVKEKYNQVLVEKIVNEIDTNFQNNNVTYSLTSIRKELICKLLNKRIDRLCQLC